jgi:hypothetical protein
MLSAASAFLGFGSLVANAGRIADARRGRFTGQDDTGRVLDLKTKFSKAASAFSIKQALSSVAMILSASTLGNYLSKGLGGGGETATELALGVAFAAAGIGLGWQAHKNAEKMSVYEAFIAREQQKPSAPVAKP